MSERFISAVAVNDKELKDLGVEVLSASVYSVFEHKMWIEHALSKMVAGGIPFHMVSDADGNVGQDYGVYGESFGTEMRGRLIIDPEGIIQVIEVLTPAIGQRLSAR